MYRLSSKLLETKIETGRVGPGFMPKPMGLYVKKHKQTNSHYLLLNYELFCCSSSKNILLFVVKLWIIFSSIRKITLLIVLLYGLFFQQVWVGPWARAGKAKQVHAGMGLEERPMGGRFRSTIWRFKIQKWLISICPHIIMEVE